MSHSQPVQPTHQWEEEHLFMDSQHSPQLPPHMQEPSSQESSRNGNALLQSKVGKPAKMKHEYSSLSGSLASKPDHQNDSHHSCMIDNPWSTKWERVRPIVEYED